MASESPYRFEDGDGYGLIELLPALNECPWNEIEKHGGEIVARLEGRRSPRLLVDLTPLDYMGSAMVALVVRLWKSVKEQAGSMVVVNRDAMVGEVLTLAGLHKVWTIVDSREAGLRVLGVSGAARAPDEAARGNGILALGLTAAVGAVIAVGLLLSKSQAVSARIAIGIDLGCALVGLVAGTILAVRDGNLGRRMLGVVMVVVCLAAMLAGLLNLPTG